MLERWVTPQPLLVVWASPISAPRLWPLQVAEVVDMMLQPARLAFGAPLVRMPWTPLPASASRQYWVEGGSCWEIAAALNDFCRAPLAAASPLKPTTCEKNSGTRRVIVTL